MKETTGNCLQFKILDSYNFNIFVMNIILINGWKFMKKAEGCCVLEHIAYWSGIFRSS
jgi:hypothetical protein